MGKKYCLIFYSFWFPLLYSFCSDPLSGHPKASISEFLLAGFFPIDFFACSLHTKSTKQEQGKHGTSEKGALTGVVFSDWSRGCAFPTRWRPSKVECVQHVSHVFDFNTLSLETCVQLLYTKAAPPHQSHTNFASNASWVHMWLSLSDELISNMKFSRVRWTAHQRTTTSCQTFSLYCQFLSD